MSTNPNPSQSLSTLSSYNRQSHPPRTLSPSHLHSLLPRSNPILYGWTFLPSWPAIASWPVMSTRNILKTTCASIAVQETTVSPKGCSTSVTTNPPAAASEKPLENRERLSGLCTDWGPYWTSLYSNEFDLTQHICSFQSSFTLCFPYLTLDPWSGSP